MVSITGILTLAFLLLVVLPPLRLLVIERFLKGFARAYRLHHVIGLLVILGGAIHAILAMYPVVRLAEGWGEGVGFFIDPQDHIVFSGTVAFVLLAAIVAAAVLPLPRQRWLVIHRIAILAFFVAAIHVYLAWNPAYLEPDRLSDLVKLLGLLLFAMAGGLLIIHVVRPEWLGTHFAFTVTKAESPYPDLVALALHLKGGSGKWQGGDFGFFRFDCSGPCGVTKERHPFTIVDADKNDVKIYIKALGDDTRRLQSIKIGTTGEVTGPFGLLKTLLNNPKEQVWISGGIGVLPFWGLLNTQQKLDQPLPKTTLFYLHRTGKSPPFLEEVLATAKKTPNLEIYTAESQPGQEIDPGALLEQVSDWRNRDYALAGPHPMIQMWTAYLRAKGIPQSRIYTEDFLK